MGGEGVGMNVEALCRRETVQTCSQTPHTTTTRSMSRNFVSTSSGDGTVFDPRLTRDSVDTGPHVITISDRTSHDLPTAVLTLPVVFNALSLYLDHD